MAVSAMLLMRGIGWCCAVLLPCCLASSRLSGPVLPWPP